MLIPTPIVYLDSSPSIGRTCFYVNLLRLLSILLLPRIHLRSIDWSFVRAVRSDASAVAPSAPSRL